MNCKNCGCLIEQHTSPMNETRWIHASGPFEGWKYCPVSERVDGRLLLEGEPISLGDTDNYGPPFGVPKE